MVVQGPERPRVLAVEASGPGASGGPALSPLDLALLRGEAAFETMRVYRGRPFRLDAHLDRLAVSAAGLDLALPHGLQELTGRAVGSAGAGDAVLRLICTRGIDGDFASTAFAIVTELPPEYELERRRGLRLVLLTMAADPLVRAASPWLLPGVKSISYAVNMAAQRQARRMGADDAVFVGLGGELLEGPTANLWWRVGDTLYTPSLDLGILAGITRLTLLELAPGGGYRVVEGVFTAEDLADAEEAFTSSSTREIMPITAVDGQPVGSGAPGPAAAALQAALRHLAEHGPLT
jgi:4-amino-4-deoxychorismate lyase